MNFFAGRFSARQTMVAACAWVLAAHTGAGAVEPDRTQQPAPGVPTAWSPPVPQRVNVLGLKGKLVERHDLPIVALTFAWDVGSASDAAGKEGAHAVCLDLLDEATARLTQSALEDAKADLGASISASAGAEMTTLSIQVVRDRLPQTLDLVSQILLEPALAQSDFERLRAQAKAAILQQRGSVEGAARRALGPVTWGAEHPLGRVATDRSLDAITRDDCVRIAAGLRPRGAHMLAVGDVTPADLTALMRTRLGRWTGKAPALRKFPAGTPARGSIYVVNVPNAAQTRLIVAHGGPSRRDADFFDTAIMSSVLGVGLPSRLVQNLREKNGYTYGVRAGFDYARRGSVFTASTSVRTDVTGPALREMDLELRGMTERPVTDGEVEREREGSRRAFPDRFGSGGSTLGGLVELAFFGLPDDTWAKTPAALDAVTTTKVRAAAAKHLHPRDAVVVVAGDKSVIWPELEKLTAEKLFGAQSLVEIDADGVVVTQAPPASR